MEIIECKMESQDSGFVNDVLVILGHGWRYPFSFCSRFGANMRNGALEDHISCHLRMLRDECLSRRVLGELVHHLNTHGRWLCVSATKRTGWGLFAKTVIVGSHI